MPRRAAETRGSARGVSGHLGRTQQGREPEVGRPVLPSGRKGRRHGRLVHRRRARQCGAL